MDRKGESIYMAKQQEMCFLCGKTKSEVNRMIKGKFGYVVTFHL